MRRVPKTWLARWAAAVGVAVGVALVGPAAASAHPGQAAPIRVNAQLACLDGGGALIDLTIRNLGKDTIRLDSDFHLFLGTVRPGGQEPAGIVFVFPAPDSGVIAPGGASTFQVPIGDVVEPGEPGLDLGAKRLLLEAEIFLAGRDQPVRRHFSFPGCGA